MNPSWKGSNASVLVPQSTCMYKWNISYIKSLRQELSWNFGYCIYVFMALIKFLGPIPWKPQELFKTAKPFVI